MKVLEPLVKGRLKLIDSHVHVEFDAKNREHNLKTYGIDPSFESLLKEMKENNVDRVVLISEGEDENAQFLKLGTDREKVLLAMYASPLKTQSQEYVAGVENHLKNGAFGAMKIYPGFEYFNPSEENCKPIFQLAEKYGVPVIIHTGDTDNGLKFGKKPKVKYARPHYIDDAAVDFPSAKIVIAHAGNPWVRDAAEVAYKNPNVFLDISGLAIGKIDKGSDEVMKQNLKFILSFVGADKVLYGTDWPLVKMKDYLGFVKKNINVKKDDLEKILYRNALKVFWNK